MLESAGDPGVSDELQRTAILKPKKRGDRARDERQALIGRRYWARCLGFCVAVSLYRYYGREYGLERSARQNSPASAYPASVF